MRMKKRGWMSSKRAQITIFIILGVILLFSSALVLYIKKQVEGVPIEVKAAVEKVPLEVKPVQDFVTSCVEQVGEQGIRKLGTQGGYIDVSRFEASTMDPTEGDAVWFVPGIKVPYWYYIKGPNTCSGDCIRGSNIPPLTGSASNSFESQINRYVNENLKECFGDFRKFKEEGFEVVEVSDVRTKTTVGQNNVYLEVSYEIDVTKDNVKQRMTRYFTSLPVNLKGIYDLAMEVVNLEEEIDFLELTALELVAVYSGLDPFLLPPIYEVETTPQPSVKSWSVNVAEQDFQQLLTTFVPRFQMVNTKNYLRRDLGDPVLQRMRVDNFVIPTDKSFQNLALNFHYMNWPIYLNINNQKKVRPESMTMLDYIPFIGLHRYEAAYDFSFPVAASIKDYSAFNNRGFEFFFAMEANVRDNLVLRPDYVAMPPIDFGVSIFCNEEQKVTGDYTFTVTDSASGELLDEVLVAYRCGDIVCQIGETKDGKLVERLPQCAGGVVQFSKYGYLGTAQQTSTAERSVDFISQQMHKIVPVQVSAMKTRVLLKEKTETDVLSGLGRIYQLIASSPLAVAGLPVAREWWTAATHVTSDGLFKKTIRYFEYSPAPVPLDGDEEVIITFERIPEPGEDELTAMAMVTAGTTQEVNLAPGKYNVNANLILKHAIVIPEDPRAYCYKADVWDYLTGDKECMKMDRVDLPQFPRGGVMFGPDETYFEIAKADLRKNKLTMYVISVPDGLAIEDDGTTKPRLRHDDLKLITKVEDYSKWYRGSLEPRFE